MSVPQFHWRDDDDGDLLFATQNYCVKYCSPFIPHFAQNTLNKTFTIPMSYGHATQKTRSKTRQYEYERNTKCCWSLIFVFLYVLVRRSYFLFLLNSIPRDWNRSGNGMPCIHKRLNINNIIGSEVVSLSLRMSLSLHPSLFLFSSAAQICHGIKCTKRCVAHVPFSIVVVTLSRPSRPPSLAWGMAWALSTQQYFSFRVE